MNKSICLCVAFVLMASCAFASAGAYYIKTDADGYVIDITRFETDGYVLVDIQGDIPANILTQCYRLADGNFVLDEDKYAAWLASNPVEVSTPDAIGGGE